MTDEQRRHLNEGEKAGLRYRLGLPPRAAGGPGTALGRRAGSSLEFRDYREYQPGDDLRHVDWNAYARSDQLTLKLFREEVTPHLDLVLDGSRSMALEGSAKEAAALGLAAFFASAAASSGHTHAAWLLGDRLAPVVNGTRAPSSWDGLSFVHGSRASADFLGAAWRPRGIRVLVSDLLWDVDPLLALRHLTERAALAIVVQVLAEADVSPPEGGSLRLVDSETEEVLEVHVDAVAVRHYRTALARHQEGWHQACRQTGAVFTTVVAESLLRDWRLDDLVAVEVLRVV